MHPSHPRLYDAVIAGAGPVGLFLACELQLAGCSVLVLEQARDPHSPFKRLPFGLRGLSVATLDSFDRRGLLDALKARVATRDMSPAAHWTGQPRQPGGHFAGIPFFLDQVDTARWSYRLPGAINGLAADMASIEDVLETRARELGADIRRGCGVDAVGQSNDEVAVHAGGVVFRGQWLIGCDGGRSAVRKAAGIGFCGTDPAFTGYSVQVRLADADRLAPGRHNTVAGMYTFTPPGTIAMADFDGGAFHRTAPITREHVERVLRRIAGVDVTVTALDLATTWTDRAFQATAYRQGRVLLAGDAAHVHSPLGGQGLNLGLGDAMNLGWKLAAVIRGHAPHDLLDTYAAERQPVGAQVLDWSRAQVALMRPCPSSQALAAIMRDVIATRDGATLVAERVWGVGLRYDLGDRHPLVGRSAPDVALSDGTRLNEHLRHGKGLLIDVDAPASWRAVAEGRLGCVRSAATTGPAGDAMLIRPDGVVAWAGDSADRTGAAVAMSRWFGR